MENKLVDVYIGVGSNIQPVKNILGAFRLLDTDIAIAATSAFYKTKAIDRPDQEDYLNGVWLVRTLRSAIEIKKQVLEKIENSLKRVRTEDKFSSRIIDLDIILYGDMVIEEMGIPDKDIFKRPFLAIPLFELNPDLSIPGESLSIAEIIKGMKMSGLEEYTELTKILKESIKK